jgi:uncharacterized protein HemY
MMKHLSIRASLSVALVLLALSAVLLMSVAVSAADDGTGKRGMTEEAFAERLAAGVEAGKLTQAEADAKLEAWSAKPARHGKLRKRGMTEEAFAERLAAKVEAGKLTQAEADAKLEAWSAKPARHGKLRKRGITEEAFAERLAAGVEAGKLTQAEADAKLEAWRTKPKKLPRRARVGRS